MKTLTPYLSRLNRHFISFFAASVFSVLIACNSANAEPQNLSLLKNEVVRYHDSGTYTQELDTEVAKAREFLQVQVKQNQQQHSKKRLAVVLDIDETSISNYQTMKNRSFSATHKQINEDIAKANAPAIAATLALFNQAKKAGVDVFFVTGRTQSQEAVTKKNLQRAGFKGYRGIYFKPDDYRQDSIVPFKSQARAVIEKQGYTVIINMGDQYSDLIGGHAIRGFKLPNPYYFLA